MSSSNTQPDNSLFDELCRLNQLEQGWQFAQHDSRDDFIADTAGYLDYGIQRSRRLQFLSEQLSTDRYRPRRCTKIDVPKSGLAVRPGETLHIEDSIVMHAITYLLAPRLDREFGDEVYSYRLAPDWEKRAKRAKQIFGFTRSEDIPFLKNKTIHKIYRTKPWFYTWPEFDAEAAAAIIESKYTHLTITDISSYFENIDIDLLDIQLRKLVPNEPRIIHLYTSILRHWSRRTLAGRSMNRGIPQGNDVSSFIGNVYLLPLDEKLREFCGNHDAIWFRYMDDVKVFSKSYDVARECVFLINDTLRSLSLNIQGAKTKILSDKALRDEVIDIDLTRINEAIKDIEELAKRDTGDYSSTTARLKKVDDIVSRYTRGLPESVSNLSGPENRLFRRCLTLYGSCYRARLRRAALASLSRIPDKRVLDSVGRYLKKLPYKYHDAIIDEILTAIESKNILFPYQIASLLELLQKLHPSSLDGIGPRIRKIAFSERTMHWAVKQKALETLTTYKYPSQHLSRLISHCLDDAEPAVQRAGMYCYCFQDDVESNRREVESYSRDANPDIARIATYWWYCINDVQFASKEIKRQKASYIDDSRFSNALPQMYAFRCSPHIEIVRSLRQVIINRLAKSKSARIKWHAERLEKFTAYAK